MRPQMMLLTCFVVVLMTVSTYCLEVQLDIDRCRDYYLANDWSYGRVTWQGRSLPTRQCNMSMSFERTGQDDLSYICVTFDHYSHFDCSWILGLYCKGGAPRVMQCRQNSSYQNTAAWCCEGQSKIAISLKTTSKDLMGNENGFILRLERMGYIDSTTYAYIQLTVGIVCSLVVILIICATVAICLYKRKLKKLAASNPDPATPSQDLAYTWNSGEPEIVLGPPPSVLPSYGEHQSLSFNPPSYNEAMSIPATPSDKTSTDAS